MNSKEKLAQALEEALIKYKGETVVADNITRGINKMIQKAKDGYYSDYDSPIATPCIQLVMDLRSLGIEDIAKRAIEGEFDATQEESDEWYKREGKQMIIESGLPLEMFERPKEEQESKEGIKGWDI